MILAIAFVAAVGYAGYKYFQHHSLSTTVAAVKAEIAKLEVEAKSGVSAEEIKAKSVLSGAVARIKSILLA